MYSFGKALQIIGIVQILIALYWGILKNDTTNETVMLVTAVILFFVGRVFEKRAAEG
jgi:hypothetical protein